MGGGIHAHAGAAGDLKRGDASGGGHEGLGIFGVDAALDAVAAKLHRADGVLELLAGGNADLRLDQVHVGDHLGDRMFHLNARVHLDEVERAVLVHQELDRAGIGVADLAAARRRPGGPARARLCGVSAGEGDSSTSF